MHGNPGYHHQRELALTVEIHRRTYASRLLGLTNGRSSDIGPWHRCTRPRWDSGSWGNLIAAYYCEAVCVTRTVFGGRNASCPSKAQDVRRR
ncbi:hypothetical protein IG631_02465 [Alternaria alternata]|nr:hypothetical protein IG631_02465 [Alternaria alternata]